MDDQLQGSKSCGITRLYDAALRGDVHYLLDLLQEDPFILHKDIILTNSSCSIQSSLHVAVIMGHAEFVAEILCRNPELAEEVDQSNRFSPLHVASSKGHLEVVKILIKVNPSMCLARDRDGRNPIQLASIKGQVDVLEDLHEANPHAARERINGGETILHMCIKFNQFRALEALLNLMDGDVELLNAKDGDGNTILHLAMADGKLEMLDFLLRCPQTDKNAINKNGMTIVDMYKQSNKKSKFRYKMSSTIEQPLKQAKALPSKDILTHQANSTWLEEQRSSLMVVASLIATMAFQVGINPPGGTWQDTKHGHEVGLSVMSSDKDSARMSYDELLVSNTIGLTSSLCVILLLISGLPCKRFGLFFLRTTLWIAVTATAATYFISIGYLMEVTIEHERIFREAFECSLKVWSGIMGIILLGHAIRFIFKKIGWRKREKILHVLRCSPKNNTSDHP